MPKSKSLFHQLKSVVGYSIATVVILLALSVSGLRFFLTTANLYHDEVEALASSLLEHPVKIGSMDAKLSGLMPTLIFHDIQLIGDKSKTPVFSLARIDVGISFEELLFRQEIIPTQLTIRGMDLNITRTVEGKFKIENISLEQFSASETDDDTASSILERWLLLKSEIAIEDSSVTWKDEQNAGLTWVFNDINFLLKNSYLHHQLSLKGNLPNLLGDKIKLDFDIEGELNKPFSWNVQLFVESENVNLQAVQKYIKNNHFKISKGTVDLKLWADWNKGKINKFSGDIGLSDAAYNFPGKKDVNVDFVSAIFDSVQDENNVWNVSVDKFNYKNNKRIWPESKFSLVFDYKDKSIDELYIKADYLKLAALAQIISDNNLINHENKKTLNKLNIRGAVRDFNVVWNEHELHKIKATFDEFSINAWNSIPQLNNISGNFYFEENNGNISILSKNSSISFPDLFRKEFKLKDLSADISVTKMNKGFLFEIPELFTDSDEVNSLSAVTFWLPNGKASPYLDLQTYISKGKANNISHYLPVSIMSKSLVTWLDQAFLAGDIDKGTIIFNGLLNKFPFDNNDGAFSVSVDASNMKFNYKNSWPLIEQAKMKAKFTGQSMRLEFLNAKVENNILYDSYADISSFKNADLNLSLMAKGSTHNFFRYIVNSPILPKAKKAVESMRLLGEVVTNVKVNIPLSDQLIKKKALSYSGSSSLHASSVYMLDDKLDITAINGKVFFNEGEVFSNNLNAKIFGKPAKLSVKTLKENKGIKIHAKGKINFGELLTRFEIPGAKNISGVTPFIGDMLFPGTAVKNPYPVISINSQLIGVKSTFPDFLSKEKKNQQNLKFKAILKENNKTQFDLVFKDNGSAVIEIDETPSGITYLNKGAVSFSARKAILPHQDVLYIDGKITGFTPTEWFKALGLNESNKPQSFFINPIVINLDEFKLLTSNENEEDAVASNPIFLPKFEGIFKRFSFDDIFIGRLDFKTSKQKQGMRFDEVIVSSRNMKLFANGEWQNNNGEHKTSLDVTLSSKNFGGLLTDLGFSPTIAEGEAKTLGKLHWYGSPSQFSLDKLNGVVQLEIKKGNIINVDAGAGRLLGFFSLAALPRKLLGDFKESIGKGFSFDKAKGKISIKNGNAFTDGFEIKSPIAEVSVRGRTGLDTRDYDNIVEVVPDVGDGVTGLVALLVNLPAGIGLWLVDKMTGEQFDKASTRIYEVTGSWDNPVIEQLDRE